MISLHIGGWKDDFSDLITTNIRMPVSEDDLKHSLLNIGVDIEKPDNCCIKSFNGRYVNINQ